MSVGKINKLEKRIDELEAELTRIYNVMDDLPIDFDELLEELK